MLKSITHLLPLTFICKSSPHLKDRRIIRILWLSGFEQVCFDFVDRFLQLFRRLKKRDCIVVTFAHLTTIQALQHSNIVVNNRLGQREHRSEIMIEPLRNISRHFNVLDLIPANGHVVGVEDQDIRGHQYGV